MSDTTFMQLTRIGPVYLYWSEHSDAAVIGPAQGAWGGDDVYRCDACPDWQSDEAEDQDAHVARHGYFVQCLTAVTLQ